jgi:hypothetical protein
VTSETNLGALTTEAVRPGGLGLGAEQLIGAPAVQVGVSAGTSYSPPDNVVDWYGIR